MLVADPITLRTASDDDHEEEEAAAGRNSRRRAEADYVTARLQNELADANPGLERDPRVRFGIFRFHFDDGSADGKEMRQHPIGRGRRERSERGIAERGITGRGVGERRKDEERR